MNSKPATDATDATGFFHVSPSTCARDASDIAETVASVASVASLGGGEMSATFSRDIRRRMEAEAKTLSVRLSRTIMDYDARGSLVRVNDPRAQAVLQRAFELLLRAGGKPQILQLAATVAAAFPRGSTAPAIAPRRGLPWVSTLPDWRQTAFVGRRCSTSNPRRGVPTSRW